MSEVWIVECDHEPMLINGKPVCYVDSPTGWQAVRSYLNRFPTDDGHYYDAVLYRRRDLKQEFK